MLRAAIAAEVGRGRLTLLPAGLDEASFAELLLRAAYGLKSPEPVPLSATEFQSRLGQLITLLCASLIPPRSPKPRVRSSR
jgi:hypothetical protein